MLVPYKSGLGQGHNQKKDTHTLDLDVTLPLGLKQLTSPIFRFAKIYSPSPEYRAACCRELHCQKRFNDRSKGFPFVKCGTSICK
jgi:hypothetical protein